MMKMKLKIRFMCTEIVHVHRNLDGIEVLRLRCWEVFLELSFDSSKQGPHYVLINHHKNKIRTPSR